jgi:hypothetical protein
MNFNAAHEILLVMTIATGILFLIAVPLGIIVTYTRSERKRRRQAGGDDDSDDFVLSMTTRPPISKNALLFIWMRSAVHIVLGLCLLTVYAAKNTNIESSSYYDYYGPMHVRSYTIEMREFLQFSPGQAHKRWIQGSATFALEWSSIGAEEKYDSTDEGTVCLSQTIYQPCIFAGLTCDSSTKPCSSEVIHLERDRVRECVQDALELYNDNWTLELTKPIRSAEDPSRTFIARHRQDLPILLFHGDSATCSAGSYNGNELSSAGRGKYYLVYLGSACIVFGIGMLLIQAAITLRVHQIRNRDEEYGDDGDTECCSVASLEDA